MRRITRAPRAIPRMAALDIVTTKATVKKRKEKKNYYSNLQLNSIQF